jgi:hypothetical protein
MQQLYQLLTFAQVCKASGLTHEQLMSMFMRGFIPDTFTVKQVGSHVKKYRYEILRYIKDHL